MTQLAQVLLVRGDSHLGHGVQAGSGNAAHSSRVRSTPGRVEAMVDAPITDDAHRAYTDALIPRVEALLAAIALPRAWSGEIGGHAESGPA